MLIAFPAPEQLKPGSSSETKLTPVAVSELDAAAATLVSSQAAQRIADAKTCKAQLVVLTIVKKGGAPDTTIRIGSGDYVSPPFLVTDKPQQVAVPFPAPYPVGKGVISIMGEGKDITVWMTPGWTVLRSNGCKRRPTRATHSHRPRSTMPTPMAKAGTKRTSRPPLPGIASPPTRSRPTPSASSDSFI